ncbi:MAG TPA: glycosyltransferase family 4 protein [Rhizomicrobium sp.]|jgi:glycosyltransferase involved in cell wall biosynthesis|nr:glycosyltransferase family 4 protein [Rhizomicrobium sp.]
MKIAQIAPLVESVPPTLYGGTERVASWLTEELVNQGHDVTLFASGDSQTQARLVPIVERALRLDNRVRDCLPYNFIMLDQVAELAREFDVLHFHIDFMHYPMFRDMPNRTLTTLHGRLDLPDLQPIYKAFPHMPLVSISNHQRQPMPPVNWMDTVYHGLPTKLFRGTTEHQGYLAFLGRISPEKRPDRAIAIAKATGIPLKIAAKVDVVDRAYFETQIEPLMDSGLIEFIGEIGETQKQEFLGNARALLFPIDWPEPFGLVMIEAMACGTPVIAFRCGSVPEVMDDGVTGFVVNSMEEAIAAVGKIDALDRALVRQKFEERFTAPVMTKHYVEIYKKLMQAQMRSVKAA